MRWLRQEGESKFEQCKELMIDFDNREIVYNGWFNHPMGGGGNTRKFAFEAVGDEDFTLFLKIDLCESLDRIFGAGANEDFYRILKMSKEEYVAEGFDKKEIVIDLVEN